MLPSKCIFFFNLNVAYCLLSSTHSVPFLNTTASQCVTLSNLVPELVSFPNSSIYKSSILSYFFVQARILPACVVQPVTTDDVVNIVRVLGAIDKSKPESSLFSVRSGGHSPVVGASNDINGVTIDLRYLNTLTLDVNKSVVSVGGGVIWDDIYSKLDPLNLTVVGGRVSGIGVGGFLTGGGLSFLGPDKGFGCDNIVNMEVVLSSGDVIQVNDSSYPDLFRALKGGSNNFGIVTRFDLKTYSLGNFWGGGLQYSISAAQDQLEAFATYMDPKNFDPHAEVEQSFLYLNSTDTFFIANNNFYTKPVVDPKALQPFSTNASSLIANTMRISNMSDFVTVLGNDQAAQQQGLYANAVFRPTLPVTQKIYQLWNATVEPLRKVENLVYTLVFQSLPKILPGNSLGLDAEDHLGLVTLALTWSKSEDSQLVLATTELLMKEIESVSSSKSNFVYLNYAASYQDPVSSYGSASKAFLRSVSKKYDPEGLFQTGVPGGFKLFS